ncbi:hypothetical protein G7Y89_g1534 [Cudoniella acicularis]|uniref:6-methylsalicylate decarboxylase n=1 Tax=Cudoniella acicularis TaxID=354080 RepID=A0A8H4W7B6_9HELO|nr:hypothetical protein G7Y89_g1534 [Cudoniella acicularis]
MTSSTPNQKIDVHHHFVPKCYADAFSRDPSGWKLPSWDVESSKSLMRDLNIGTSILSLTAPGCAVLSGPAAASLAREVNESAAEIRNADPAHFGFFAALPPLLDDIPATLAEIAYALDVLKADGVTLYTRTGPGHTYLGNPALVPIWEELNRRHAVVFVHPTHMVDTQLVNPQLPQPMIDYPHETTRAAVDLIVNNRVREYPHCKIILSHAGGTFPYLATRAAEMLPDYGLSTKLAEEFMQDARELYYDLALSGNEYTLGLLTKFAREDHILFGSDFPYAPEKTIRTHTKNFEVFEIGDMSRYEIDRGNALKLFPRLKDALRPGQTENEH